MFHRFANRYLATADGRRKVALITALAAVVWLGALYAFRPIGSSPPAADSFYTTGPLASGGPPSGARAPFLDGSAVPRLTTVDGLPFALDALRGHPVWVVFWASWCPPCVREAPALQATYEAYRSDGLEVLAVDVGESAGDVRAFMSAHRLTYPVALDPNSDFADAYGLFGLPSHYFVDRNGIIVDRYFGELTPAAMGARARRLLGGSGSLPPSGGSP